MPFEDSNPHPHHPEAATELPAPQPPKYNWDVVEYEAEGVKACWIKIILPILNDSLKNVGACATADESNSGSLFLRVRPEIDSKEMCDWEKQVKSIIEEYLDNFKELTIPFPELGSVELLEYAKKQACSNMIVISDKDSFTIAGECAIVGTFMEDICREMITRETKEFRRCHVKYLSELCDNQLRDTRVMDYELNEDVGYIAVEANEKKREYFWSVIDKEIKSIFEKPVSVKHEEFKLLASKCGIKKMEEIIASETVVYHLEKVPPDYKIILMGPKKGPLKEIKDLLKSMIYSQAITVDPKKFRLCSDKKWRELVAKQVKERFVSVTVNESTTSIVVSGERYIVDEVLDTIDKFLLEHTSVEERLKFSSHEWKVKKEDFEREKESIQQSFGKIISFKINSDPGMASIVIRGDPKIVDRVKGKLEAIRAQVCHREVRFPNIPSAVQIIDTLEDKIMVFETSYGASIHVSWTSDSRSSEMASRSPNAKLCSATCPNEVRISVYNGDFTGHKQVDTMINFVQLDPSHQDPNLKYLFASGDHVLKDDFKTKIDHLVHKKSGTLLETNPGQLKCKELLHCFLLPWVDGKQNEEYFLETALDIALQASFKSESILLTSVCSSPLGYPPDLYAKKLVSLLNNDQNISQDLMMDVYVDTVQQAKEFETQFRESNCRITLPFNSHSAASSSTPSSSLPAHVARSITGSISSYITLTKGDLLQQQVGILVE